MKNRICTKCEQELPATTEFFYRRGDKLRTDCKECVKDRNNNHYHSNRSVILEKQREYSKLNSKKICERVIKWQGDNPEKFKSYQKTTRERQSNNPEYRIKSAIRAAFRRFISFGSGTERSRELAGCGLDELRRHIESKWVDGMSWENYGNPNGDHTNCWHIDHIKPCCSFNLIDIEEQRKCFHYTNLQPLWAKDNLSKGGKYEVS